MRSREPFAVKPETAIVQIQKVVTTARLVAQNVAFLGVASGADLVGFTGNNYLAQEPRALVGGFNPHVQVSVAISPEFVVGDPHRVFVDKIEPVHFKLAGFDYCRH